MIKTREDLRSYLTKNNCEMGTKLEGYSCIHLIDLCGEEFVLNIRDFEGNNIPHFHLTNESRDIGICTVRPWYFTHDNEVHILTKGQSNELAADLKPESLWRQIYYYWDGKTDNRSLTGRHLIKPNYKKMPAVVFGKPMTFSETWNETLIEDRKLRMPEIKVKWKYFLKHDINYVLYFKRDSDGDIRLTW